MIAMPVSNSPGPATFNVTGSKFESHVDNFMGKVQKKIINFEDFIKSPEGASRLNIVSSIALVGAGAILSMGNVLVVSASTVVGAVVQSFSEEQVVDVRDRCIKLSNAMPGPVKALAVVIAHVFVPILFPVAAGLYFGSFIGSQISPHALAKVADSFEPGINRPIPKMVSVETNDEI